MSPHDLVHVKTLWYRDITVISERSKVKRQLNNIRLGGICCVVCDSLVTLHAS